MKLAEKLVSLRKAKGMTQMKVAECLDVSRQAVSRWEVGDAIPSTENLKCLSNLFEIPMDYLVNDADDLAQGYIGNAIAKEKGKEDQKRRLFLVGLVFLVIFSFSLVGLHAFFSGRQNSDGEESISVLEEEQLEDEPEIGFELEW